MNKRRRYDAEIVTDTDISDFLDSKPDLYKKIQLSSYLRKIPQSNIEGSNPSELVLSIFKHIKDIVHKFYPELEFGDDRRIKEFNLNDNSNGKNWHREKYGDNNFIEINSWIYGYDDDESFKFFEISLDSFNDYFSYLSRKLSNEFRTNVHILVDTEFDCCFQISISGF